MELWIRSQDKNVLENVKGFCITHSDENRWNILNVDTTTRYGTYKSKERALEVLDEIQNILNLKDMYKYDREIILKSWENVDKEQVKIVRQQMSVYEMPKE